MRQTSVMSSPSQNRGEPRILLLFNPEGIVDRDIYLSATQNAIHLQAHEINISRTPEGHTVERLDLFQLAKGILEFQPDFVLTINGAGLDNERLLSHFCASLEIPLVIWYVDEPFLIPEWGQRFSPHATIAFTFDRFYERKLRNWGIEWVFTLPLGTNAERMLGYATPKRRDSRYVNRISFVGALEYSKIQYLLKNITNMWETIPPAMPAVLDKAIVEYQLSPKADPEEVIAACAKRLGLQYAFPNGIVKQMILSFIDREASFRLRQRTVEGLKPFGIAVYGEPLWRDIVGPKWYKGAIDYYSAQIAKVYNGTRINLNISKYQLKTTVNQRVFDCALCGGFLITDFKEEIEALFQIGKSIVVFRDLEDLKAKIAFYLENSDKGDDITECAREVILSTHTYNHRLRQMCRTVSEVKTDPRFNHLCQKLLPEKSSPRFNALIAFLRQEKVLPDNSTGDRMTSRIQP